MELAQVNHGAFFMLFDPGILLKKKTDTLANSANCEPETHKEASLISKLSELAEDEVQKTIIVIC